MTKKFGQARLYDDLAITPQEQVNLRMLDAIEKLGARLQKTEAERDRLAGRLALIESAATLDEKTGKLYLPVVVGQDAPPSRPAAPGWMVATTFGSCVIALCALGLALYRAPEALPLTPRQIAALDALAAPPQLVDDDAKAWKRVDEMTGLEPAAGASAEEEAPPPAPAETAKPVVAENAAPHLWEEAYGPPQPQLAVKEPEKAEAPAPQVAEVKKEAPPAPEKTVAAEKPAPVVEAHIDTTEKPAEKAEDKPVIAASQIEPDSALPAKFSDIQRRAFGGAPEAQHDLATIYAAGKAVPQDYKRAVYWFYKAADGGVANADYNLGVMFQQGLGVRKDVNKALGWYEKAAQLGHPEAMYNLGIAYVEGVGTPRNIARGVSYFKKAANAGVAQAAYNLGVLYESNFVGAIDLNKAAEWYQVAVEQGHAGAKEAVTRLRRQIAEAATTGEKGEKLATAVEPASGARDEEYGEGDSSPLDRPLNRPLDRTVDALVEKTQAALIAYGDISGTPTGVLDNKTEEAIRGWQRKLSLDETGRPSQQLLDRIRAAVSDKNKLISAPSGTPTRGSEGLPAQTRYWTPE